MLFDRKWDYGQPSLAGFTEWVGAQDGKRRYDWSNPDQCACAEYAKSIGRYVEWRMDTASSTEGSPWRYLDTLAMHHRNFGMLHKRLLQARARELAH